MLILDSHHLLLSFFQLPLTPPQPAGTAVPSSFSWKMCLLLLFKQISSHLMWWQGSPVDNSSSRLLGCSPLSLLYIAGICKGLQLLLHVSESVISLYFHHSQPRVVCLIPKPEQTSSSVKHHLCLWILWWSPVFQIFPKIIEFISVRQSHS